MEEVNTVLHRKKYFDKWFQAVNKSVDGRCSSASRLYRPVVVAVELLWASCDNTNYNTFICVELRNYKGTFYFIKFYSILHLKINVEQINVRTIITTEITTMLNKLKGKKSP